MSYGDITFCGFYKNCIDGKKCHRAFTPKIKEKAIKWWGNENAPIAYYISKPNCFKEKK